MNTHLTPDSTTPAVQEVTPSSLPLWTTREVAKFLHVSLKTVFNLRKKEGLPYVQLGGAVRFDPQKVRHYLDHNGGLSSHRLRQIAREGGRR